MAHKLIFTTLFNSYYLPKGIAMIESLSQHCDNFHLYVFAYDEKCYAYLQKQNYPNVTVLSLTQLEQHFTHDYQTVIDLSARASGVYFVRVTTQEGTITKRVVKR